MAGSSTWCRGAASPPASPTSSRPSGCDRLQPSDPLILGIDLGTSSIKAVLLDNLGDLRGAATGATPFTAGEMTVAQLFAATAAVLGQLGSARQRVVAAGIAGMAESGAPMAGDGRPLAPIIAWYDPRGAATVDRLQRECGPDLERAIGQRLRVVSSVAKLGWLVDHGVRPVTRWLGVPELVLEALTRSQLTDFSLAARTGAYHVKERRYLPDVLERLGVVDGTFPPVVPAGTTMGRVDVRGAAWSGLPVGVPVTLAGHDHLAARAGSGAGESDVVNSVGTAETVVAATASCPDVDAARSRGVAVTLLPGGDGWALLASAVRSGVVLRAIADALRRSLWELDAAAAGVAFPPRPGLTAWADRAIEAARAGGDVDAGGADPGELWHAVLAALARRTWEAYDRLVTLSRGVGKPSGRLVVCGGGSRSEPWLEAKAAMRPATRVCRLDVREAAAHGAALYAGVAAGWWPGLSDAPKPRLDTVSTGSRPP